MESLPGKEKPPDILTKQLGSSELVKMIRKLRWIGMEDEAKRVQAQLARRVVGEADSVLAASNDTD